MPSNIQRSSTTILDQLNLPQETSTAKIQHVTKALKKGTCPVTVRKLIEAEYAHQTNNGQNVRAAACVATCCSPLVIVEKIVRAFTWTFCLPCSTVVACARERKYGLTDQVSENVNRVREEWVDLIASDSVLIAGPILTCCPSSDAATNYTENMAHRYYDRTIKRKVDRENREDIIAAYDRWWKDVQQAWKTKDEIPDQRETMSLYLDEIRSAKRPFPVPNEIEKNPYIDFIEKDPFIEKDVDL